MTSSERIDILSAISGFRAEMMPRIDALDGRLRAVEEGFRAQGAVSDERLRVALAGSMTRRWVVGAVLTASGITVSIAMTIMRLLGT